MAKRRIKELEKILTEAQDAYYGSTPIMGDDEYDALADELASLSPKSKVLRRVGWGSLSNALQKAKHAIPMGSQKKVNAESEFSGWIAKTKAKFYVIQEKLDGLSIELVYKKGKLAQAITRGDGETGEDVTHNVQRISNVLPRIPNFSGSIRGEIIIPTSTFEKKVRGKTFDGGKTYKNARNAAAGMTRRKTVSMTTVKFLKVISFDCDAEGVEFKKEHHKIRFLEDAGVDCVFTRVVDTAGAIKGYNHYAEKKRAKIDHEIDGMVYKVNSIKKQIALGVVDGRPKGQIAWKFDAEMRKTVLEDITWEVGLTGRITPVAHLKAVDVAGVTIKKASLHNISNMNRLGVYPYAEVLVSRRNDVIPYVEKVIPRAKSKQRGIFFTPDDCPVCGEDTEMDGEYLVCVNLKCPARISGAIKKWVKVLDIDQVGESFITAALAAGFLKDPADLYTLSVDTIAALPGYQRKSAKTIVRNINKSREVPLKLFMAALNIPGMGRGTFAALEGAGFDSIDKILHASGPEIAMVPGLGHATAVGLKPGLALKKDLITKLQDNGVKIKKKIQGKLSGKSFCLTGQISIKRGDAHKLIESMGGEIKTSVSQGLTYLVQASATSMSGKAKKARKYGTEVLGEKEFFTMVDFSFKKLRSVT